MDGGEEAGEQLARQPVGLPLDERRMARGQGGVVGACGSADEGRGETPGQPDEDEADDVVDDGHLLPLLGLVAHGAA